MLESLLMRNLLKTVYVYTPIVSVIMLCNAGVGVYAILHPFNDKGDTAIGWFIFSLSILAAALAFHTHYKQLKDRCK